MLRPCSHMGMCSACGAMQTAGSPICREPIEGRQPAVRPSELKKDDRSRCSAPKSQVAESMSLGRTRGPGLTWLTWPDLLVLVLVGSGSMLQALYQLSDLLIGLSTGCPSCLLLWGALAATRRALGPGFLLLQLQLLLFLFLYNI